MRFFTRILSGRLVNPWMLSQAPSRKILSADRLVVKFVRGNLLLGWITHNLPVNQVVLVVRHPCAVIASQFERGWIAPLDKQGRPGGLQYLLNHPYLELRQDIRAACAELNQPEEVAAMSWCIKYHGALKSPLPHNFAVVSYEALVLNGGRELERIFRIWGVPLPKTIVSSLVQPSDTSPYGTTSVRAEQRLSQWRRTLSEQQVTNILKVLAIFDLDFYSRELEPDYEKLNRYGKSKLNE
jgi:hypothetical protein